MRRLLFAAMGLTGLAFAACSGSGGVNATFMSNSGGSGGFGGGAGGSGAGATTSTVATTSSAATTTSSTTATTSATTTSSVTASTSTGPMCDFSSPNTCDTPLELSSVNGDTGMDVRMVSGSTSKWFKIEILEGSNFDTALSFTATLDVPPGMDFDLYMYPGDINGPDCFANPTVATGSPRSVSDSWSDNFGSDDSRYYALEVRYVSGSDCNAKWTLTVTGNT